MSPSYYAPWGGDWAVWVGGAWAFNEKTTFNFEVGYDDSRAFSVAANVDYELVNNFHIIPEVVYYDGGDEFFLRWRPLRSARRTATTAGAASSVSSTTGAADSLLT